MAKGDSIKDPDYRKRKRGRPRVCKPSPGMMGRPSVYDPPYHTEMAERFGMLGMTNEQMAASFGINISTFEGWQRDKEDFRRALWNGREGANGRVAAALFNRAIGYKHKAVKINVVKIEDKVEVVKTDFVQHYPPDVAAIKMYLYNREPEKWKANLETNDTDIKVTVEGGLPNDLPEYTPGAAQPVEPITAPVASGMPSAPLDGPPAPPAEYPDVPKPRQSTRKPKRRPPGAV